MAIFQLLFRTPLLGLFAIFLSFNLPALLLGKEASSGLANLPEEKVSQKSIGLCVVATGRYDTFANAMIASARKFFCKNHKVHFFVFSDGAIPPAEDVTVVYQARLGWPHDTLKRFEIYLRSQPLLESMDYLFAIDADMSFVAPVGDEILGELVGTQHPGFVHQRGSYETNKQSTAYVSKKEGTLYYAGGFYGGQKDSFFKLLSTCKKKIDQDLKIDLIAVWHDESHLNRYFIDNPPTLTLTPSYCYPESWEIPYPKKLVALDKNHAEVRK